MRERKPLQPNTELSFTNHAGGKMCYIVGDVIGMGGSCIVYDGYYMNNTGTKNTVRIKECFPYKLHITRAEDGTLCISEREKEQFREYLERLSTSFDVANELHQASGLTNLTSNVFDLYEANNTRYIVSSYVEGHTLEDVAFETLGDAVRVAISTAKSILKIHAKGYLYLDIKPENILMYEETPDLIQLFDFDSVIPMDAEGDITEYKIAYSHGFAPLEQRLGKLSGIGAYTDIYSIGALVFYLIFGKAPKATDCGTDGRYDFANLRWNTLYQEKVYKELAIFFHNTLQAYPYDRYQTMDAVITQLMVLEKYVDLPVPFICSGYVTNGGTVVGREQECKDLWNWYCGDEKLIFVSGMGGIGKSTIVRKFVSDNKAQFDTVLYLSFRENIWETVADDVQFCINGYEKNEEETTAEYFARKIKAAKELTRDTETLLIIDNFDGTLDDGFKEVLEVDWKIIAVTRTDMSQSGYACRRIKGFGEKKELYALFENNVGRKLASKEHHQLDRLIELVSGHTLVLVLIARQIAKSYMDVDAALRLVEENGFSNMAPEKVRYMQDGKAFYDKIASIIMAVYDVSKLSENKKKCMKILSLFDIPGIQIKEAGALLKLESLDELNELIEQGWLELSDRNIQMHPLVQETMHQLPWNDEYRQIAVTEVQVLLSEIRQNGRGSQIMIEEVLGQTPTSDYQKLRQALARAKTVLLHAGKDAILYAHKSYEELMFANLMNTPKDQEEYIIRNAKKIFENAVNENIVKEKAYAIMELYDYVVYLLCQKDCFNEAWQYLEQAKAFAKQVKDHYIWGLYYDMLGDYDDSLLDGAYDTSNENECTLINRLFSSTDKSMYHMKKAIVRIQYFHRYDAKIQESLPRKEALYVKYALGKAALMIRSMPEKSRQIKKLLSQISHSMKRYSRKDAEVCSVFYMVWAWYYTLCEPEDVLVFQHLAKAAEVNAHRNMSDLDKVDYFYIPAANMMCELENIEQTLHWLDEACAICDGHVDEVPYIRKKRDLLRYKSEVISFSK